jgi:two-component system LytT family response regulator
MKIRTLLVDDQSTGLMVLRDMLRYEADIEIIGTAANGPQAIESINQLAPDLVFLDVQMPELDGFEVVAQIKLPQMPIIIFVTGHDDYALKAFEAHALDYLVNPANWSGCDRRCNGRGSKFKVTRTATSSRNWTT